MTVEDDHRVYNAFFHVDFAIPLATFFKKIAGNIPKISKETKKSRNERDAREGDKQYQERKPIRQIFSTQPGFCRKPIDSIAYIYALGSNT